MEAAQLAEIARELDDVHARAAQAFRARDVAGYMDLFSPALVYRQANGKEIGRDELTRDVERQLRSMRSFETTYTRESLAAEGAEATEFLAQTARIETVILGIFRRVWLLNRRGRYAWSRTDQGWRIARVEVLEEKVKAA